MNFQGMTYESDMSETRLRLARLELDIDKQHKVDHLFDEIRKLSEEDRNRLIEMVLAFPFPVKT